MSSDLNFFLYFLCVLFLHGFIFSSFVFFFEIVFFNCPFFQSEHSFCLFFIVSSDKMAKGNPLPQPRGTTSWSGGRRSARRSRPPRTPRAFPPGRPWRGPLLLAPPLKIPHWGAAGHVSLGGYHRGSLESGSDFRATQRHIAGASGRGWTRSGVQSGWTPM